MARVHFGKMQTQTLAPPGRCPCQLGCRVSCRVVKAAALGMLCGVTPGEDEVSSVPGGPGGGFLLGKPWGAARQSQAWTLDVPADSSDGAGPSEEATLSGWLCPISPPYALLWGVETRFPCDFLLYLYFPLQNKISFKEGALNRGTTTEQRRRKPQRLLIVISGQNIG